MWSRSLVRSARPRSCARVPLPASCCATAPTASPPSTHTAVCATATLHTVRPPQPTKPTRLAQPCTRCPRRGATPWCHTHTLPCGNHVVPSHSRCARTHADNLRPAKSPCSVYVGSLDMPCTARASRHLSPFARQTLCNPHRTMRVILASAVVLRLRLEAEKPHPHAPCITSTSLAYPSHHTQHASYVMWRSTSMPCRSMSR
jgi:hypothetical protein